MTDTPVKTGNSNIDLLQSLTPVRFLNSPKHNNTQDSPNSNALICKMRLDTILQISQDNYTKWNSANKSGLSLCYSIEGIKSRCLNGMNNSESPESHSTPYPLQLQQYCDNLALMVNALLVVMKNAQESLRQLQSLSKLSGTDKVIFYRSWRMKEFVEFFKQLAAFYKAEVEIKKLVMISLPHSMTKAELVRHTCAWEYPQNVDDTVALMFILLKEEINLKKI